MMPKYRKKPVVIEAFRWTGDSNQAKYPGWLVNKMRLGQVNITKNCTADLKHGLEIETLEGKMIAMPRDYIIKGIQGEVYPCKPDIFEQTYELVK